MANCGLTTPITIPCGKFMPGIRRIYIADFYSGSTSSAQNIAYTADATNVITAATLSNGTFLMIDLTKESSDIQDAITTNATNGTVAYETTINLYLSQYSTAMRNRIVLMAKGKSLIVFEDRNGQAWLAGTDGTGSRTGSSNGCDMEPGTATTGKAAGDTNGYTIAFKSAERVPPLEISTSVLAGISTIA